MSKNLAKKVQNFSFQQGLWEKGSKIILGVSGGPDSVCLLDILANLAPKYAFQLHLAHVNYGLRGKDSIKDEQLVEKLAAKYGLPLTILTAPVVTGPDLENKLRELRYYFFRELKKKLDFDLIAVAHSQDDQAETFLMRLIRGSGARGLSSMSPKNDIIIRPLLNSSREDILEYNRSNKLSYRIDNSNNDLIFTRNRVRHQLIPLLKSAFNSNIRRTLAENASLSAEDESFLSAEGQRHFRKGYFKSVKKLLALHPAIQKRVLLEAIRGCRGNLKDISLSNVQEMLKALRSSKNKNQTVSFKGLKLVRKGDKVILS